jgi:hypothetical protein
MIVHLKPLKGNLYIAEISLYHHILLWKLHNLTTMTATTWRFQVRKRETALTPNLDVQNCMFSNSKFQLHETNFSLLSKPLSAYNICRSRSGSNQPKSLSIASREDRPAQVKRERTPIKKKLGLPNKKAIDILKVPLDSPSTGTRSKAILLSSPAMSTRRKRRLSLWFVICLLNLLVVCETNVCLNSHSCVTSFMWDLIDV